MAIPRYEHLLGRPFKHGSTDCYGLLRDFYRDVFNISLTDYARPDNWWEQGMNLYADHFRAEGFHILDCHPNEYRFGDVALCAVISKVPNHAAIFVENGLIIHHLLGGISCKVRYEGLIRNTTCMVIRHKNAPDLEIYEAVDVRSYLPASVQREIAAAEAAGREREGGPDTA